MGRKAFVVFVVLLGLQVQGDSEPDRVAVRVMLDVLPAACRALLHLGSWCSFPTALRFPGGRRQFTLCWVFLG